MLDDFGNDYFNHVWKIQVIIKWIVMLIVYSIFLFWHFIGRSFEDKENCIKYCFI